MFLLTCIQSELCGVGHMSAVSGRYHFRSNDLLVDNEIFALDGDLWCTKITSTSCVGSSALQLLIQEYVKVP